MIFFIFLSCVFIFGAVSLEDPLWYGFLALVSLFISLLLAPNHKEKKGIVPFSEMDTATKRGLLGIKVDLFRSDGRTASMLDVVASREDEGRHYDINED